MERLKKDKIYLEELIEKSVSFIRKDIKIDELNELGKELIIKNYIPITEKLKLMMMLIFNMNQEDTEVEEVRIINLQRDLFFYVLLGAYCNVEIIDKDAVNYKNYDILYPIFSKYILQFCKEDYEMLVGMIKDSLNIYNMKELSSLLNNINYKKLEEVSEKDKKLIEELQNNKELLDKLKEVYDMSNPALKKQLELINQIAKQERDQPKKKKGSSKKDKGDK